jgi:hypothetical protein
MRHLNRKARGTSQSTPSKMFQWCYSGQDSPPPSSRDCKTHIYFSAQHLLRVFPFPQALHRIAYWQIASWDLEGKCHHFLKQRTKVTKARGRGSNQAPHRLTLGCHSGATSAFSGGQALQPSANHCCGTSIIWGKRRGREKEGVGCYPTTTFHVPCHEWGHTLKEQAGAWTLA